MGLSEPGLEDQGMDAEREQTHLEEKEPLDSQAWWPHLEL
jgi:hypothetical protein